MRSSRRRLPLPLLLLACGGAAAALAAPVAISVADAALDWMPVDQVKPGMKGHGLTVFSGTTPERFEVEIISVLRKFRPNQDLILVKTKHPRLEVARTVAGMSGSPIYLDGKMIGAYAYGWLFGAEAIAGVTPIRSMLDELERPLPRTLFPPGRPLPGRLPSGAEPGGEPGRRYTGDLTSYEIASHAEQLSRRSATGRDVPAGTTLARATTPILLGGLGDASAHLAGRMLSPLGLEPLQAGGGGAGADPRAPARHVDGGAIGVEFIRGDMSAMGLGTVTRVRGDRLVAFGHPMMNGGVTNLPTSVAKVHWILASQNRSFKIGEAARPLGALVNDRQAAIVVDQAARAPMFPLRVALHGVDGAPHPNWKVEVAHDQFLSPLFAAIAIGNAFETTSSERRDVTWRARTRIHVRRHGPLEIEDFASGAGGTPGPDEFLRARAVRAMGALLNNPWEEVHIDGVESDIHVTFAREVYQLLGAQVLEQEVEAGRPVKIRLDLMPYQGKLESRVIEVPVAPELAGREVEIDLVPGHEEDRILPTPDSLRGLFATLPRQSYPPDTIVASFKLRENGVAFRGQVASRLPPGAHDTLRPLADTSSPESFQAQVKVAVPVRRFVVGKDTVRVQVRPVLR